MTNSDWNKQIENVLYEQQNKCAAYKWLHDKQSRRFSKINKWLNIIIIFIVSLTATGTSFTNNIENFENNLWKIILNISYSILLYFSAFLSSLQHFLNYEKQAELHRTASLKYTTLYNNIKRTLLLHITQRQQATEYFIWINKEYDSVLSESPNISTNIMNEFESNFGKTLSLLSSKMDDEYFKKHQENTQDVNEEVIINVLKENEIVINSIKNKPNKLLPESEKIKYELDRYMNNSYD